MALLSWLRELQWEPGLGQVTFAELVLDFEAHSGRAMPASPGAELQSIVLSLHERAQVLRTALSVLQRHVVSGTLVQRTMTLKARSLVPLGAGPLAGLTARPYFTRRQDMRVQLQALATYCEERWVNKIGQGLSFGVGPESPERQEPAGVRRDSRLNAEDRRQAAHRLSEPMITNAGGITSKGGGSGKRGLFASDYVPLQGGRSAVGLPFAVLRPVGREVPQQPAVQRCPEHDRPACTTCAERRRGVRNCCRLGHHKEGHVHRPRPVGLCPRHSAGKCDRCKVNKRSVQYCCDMGHHGDKRKPGPRAGSKRSAPEDGSVQGRQQRRPVPGGTQEVVVQQPTSS